MALFVVQICRHLHDQNRDQTVTPGTSQVGISLFFGGVVIVHPWVTAEQVRALLLPAPVTLKGTAEHLRASRCKDAFSFLLPDGWRVRYRWAFNSTDVVGGKR